MSVLPLFQSMLYRLSFPHTEPTPHPRSPGLRPTLRAARILQAEILRAAAAKAELLQAELLPRSVPGDSKPPGVVQV